MEICLIKPTQSRDSILATRQSQPTDRQGTDSRHTEPAGGTVGNSLHSCTEQAQQGMLGLRMGRGVQALGLHRAFALLLVGGLATHLHNQEGFCPISHARTKTAIPHSVVCRKA